MSPPQHLSTGHAARYPGSRQEIPGHFHSARKHPLKWSFSRRITLKIQFFYSTHHSPGSRTGLRTHQPVPGAECGLEADGVLQSASFILIAFLGSLWFVIFAIGHYFQTCKCAQRSYGSHVSKMNMRKKNKRLLQAGTDPHAEQLCELWLCANMENKCL